MSAPEEDKNDGRDKKEIINAVKEELGTEFEVFFTQTGQNNGTEQKCITVMPKSNIMGAGFRIELQFKGDLVEETEIKDMARNLVDDCMGYHGREPISGLTVRLDKRTILMKVEYQMINAEKNEARLTEMPHERLLDLAAIYRVILSEDAERKISFAVTHSLCEEYKISREELDAAARYNMEIQGFRDRLWKSFYQSLQGFQRKCLREVSRCILSVTGAGITERPLCSAAACLEYWPENWKAISVSCHVALMKSSRYPQTGMTRQN